ATIAAIGFFLLSALYSRSNSIIIWVAHLALLGLVYVLSTQPVFKNARTLLIAIAPYILIHAFSDLSKIIIPAFHKQWQEIFEIAIVFAILWGAGTWWITNRQRKALAREKAKTKQEEEQNKVISAMKEQLEVQVAERTAELTKQKEDLQHTLHELRSTQAQLIQSEKMASLGELTAGIAHEIQNPLNFVNNFSEINTELLAEMKQEIEKGNIAEVKAIISNIAENEQKINHHGKRADAIVKGMLQHSRSSSGQKDLTDINALADEYFRLAYHGLRAKNKSFNATMRTHFDETIGKVNVVPQDLGRVILNLITNAFYAVNEKAKDLPDRTAYEPTVTISTKKEKGRVFISVKDNGNGIPHHIKDKIFQPFFTTKPTGQGTGLGLSLSYDIITKAHGGELTVVTKEGEGSEFVIQLPIV
ncbi:MAG TPA: ATP-binding protein, partial [Agriterribacter sp.]|nr:ATP-binding protein [Agriterribacter sp.]